MERKIITTEELKKMFDGKEDFLLLDVLPPEYFAEKHIAGAQNAPVYEVGFLAYLEKMDVPKNKKIVVYNEKEESLATVDAAAKLKKAGYADVLEFPGGLLKWEEIGLPLERGEAAASFKIVDGEYGLDAENSIVGWSGRSTTKGHRGRITIKSGGIVVENKKIISGKILLDMTTIKDEDLSDETWRSVLESHLKSSDFFEVEEFPEASFEFRSMQEIAGSKTGIPNYQISGVLSIKGVSREIDFSALIAATGDGVIHGQAHFDFDRTLWNVRYGSERFFEKLGMHLVNDMVSLELFLVAKKLI